jgi:hypothetical protein
MTIKKLLHSLPLASLLFSSTTQADTTGAGWKETLCPTKYTYYDGLPIVKKCHKPKFNYLGLQLDAGVPSGLGLSFVGKPVRFMQLEAGGTTTLVGGGVKLGTTVFLPYYVSPGITFEYGHQWFSSANKLATLLGASSPNISLLDHIEYDYINLLGSIGVGSPNHFFFRLNAGYTYLWGNTNGLQAYIQEKTGNNSITTKEATAKVLSPTAKLVFLIYF